MLSAWRFGTALRGFRKSPIQRRAPDFEAAGYVRCAVPTFEHFARRLKA